MRRGFLGTTLFIALSVTAAAQNPVIVQPGAIVGTWEIGSSAAVSIEAARVVCAAATPASCPAPPAIGGVSDTNTAYSAEQLAGRTVIITNAGPGVLSLQQEHPQTAAQWRIAQAKVLAAGEAAVLVYDGATARWQVQGAKPPALTGPGGLQ